MIEKKQVVKKTIEVEITYNEMIECFVGSLATKMRGFTGKDDALSRAFGALVGRTDVEAVKIANEYAAQRGLPRITTAEFRLWIPKMLSDIFMEYKKS